MTSFKHAESLSLRSFMKLPHEISIREEIMLSSTMSVRSCARFGSN
jgi:hypothetical protein